MMNKMKGLFLSQREGSEPSRMPPWGVTLAWDAIGVAAVAVAVAVAERCDAEDMVEEDGDLQMG